MRILVTNDDGIHAAGLTALCRSLADIGEVIAVAPERPRSASGHAITLHKPLRLRPVTLARGAQGYASNGTPADCVALGASDHLGPPPDLVVSGINLGPNLGVDMVYSGTVAAAMEAAISGLPSFAISVASYEASDFQPAGDFARYLAERVGQRGLPEGVFLNVNVPAVPLSDIAGVTVTRQGRVRYSNRIERRTDPRGIAYYWLTGERVDSTGRTEGDAAAVRRGFVSVTPVRLDLTHDGLLDGLRGWGLDWPQR